MSNWSFSPYFYSRISNWYKLNLINYQFVEINSSLSSTRFFLKNLNYYWSDLYFKNFFNTKNVNSTLSYSTQNSPYRSSWRPLYGFESYIYNNGLLTDILSKREYIYRQLFLKKKL
jgi:hypothetical protein